LLACLRQAEQRREAITGTADESRLAGQDVVLTGAARPCA
jgi:hypothetical protein